MGGYITIHTVYLDVELCETLGWHGTSVVFLASAVVVDAGVELLLGTLFAWTTLNHVGLTFGTVTYKSMMSSGKTAGLIWRNTGVCSIRCYGVYFCQRQPTLLAVGAWWVWLLRLVLAGLPWALVEQFGWTRVAVIGSLETVIIGGLRLDGRFIHQVAWFVCWLLNFNQINSHINQSRMCATACFPFICFDRVNGPAADLDGESGIWMELLGYAWTK